MFKLYTAKVRLSGSVLNEVPKDDLTAPEIEVLRALHGSDAVVEIKETGEHKRTHAQERARLKQIYASQGMGEQVKKKLALMTEIFGHERLPLPTSIEEHVETVDDEDAPEAEQEPVAAKPALKRSAVKEAAFLA